MHQPQVVNPEISDEEELAFYLVFQECPVWSAQEGRAISSSSPGSSKGAASRWRSGWKTGKSKPHLIERLLEGERPHFAESNNKGL